MSGINQIIKLASLFYKRAQENLFLTEQDLRESILGEGEKPDIDTTSAQVPSPQLAHNNFLIDVIRRFNLDLKKDEFIPAVNKFVEDNAQAINKLRRLFGVANPKYLGGGADGLAYDIGNGLVAKFLTDPFPVEKAMEAMDRLHKPTSISKTETMTYDVGSLGELPDSGETLYYIVLEKMTPVGNIDYTTYRSIAELNDFVISKIEDYFAENVWNQRDIRGESLKDNYLNPDIKYMIEDLKTNYKWIQDYIDQINTSTKRSQIFLRPDWFERYVEEVFDKVATERGDLHPGNLGITGYGTLSFYDPAHSSWKSRRVNR